jgi:hypothetical protein
VRVRKTRSESMWLKTNSWASKPVPTQDCSFGLLPRDLAAQGLVELLSRMLPIVKMGNFPLLHHFLWDRLVV